MRDLIQLVSGRIAPQIQGEGKFRIRLRRRYSHLAGSVSMSEEARQAATFSLVGIDREGVVAASARVADVAGATADAARVPGVDDVEH